MESSGVKTSNRNVIIGVSLIGIVVIGFGIYGIGKIFDNDEDPDYSNYYIAPALNVTDLDDQLYELEDYVNVSAVILYFHFLGCTYCGSHGPILEYATGDYSPNQVKIFAITVDPGDSDNNLLNWAEYNGHDSWVLARDEDRTLRNAFSY
jgi:hypothetical protein